MRTTRSGDRAENPWAPSCRVQARVAIRAKLRQHRANLCNISGGSYFFGLTAMGPRHAVAALLRTDVRHSRKLRERIVVFLPRGCPAMSKPVLVATFKRGRLVESNV